MDPGSDACPSRRLHLRQTVARALGSLLLGAALLVSNPDDAAAGLLAHEGFNYASGAGLTGQSGGTGWSNRWMDVSANLGATVSAGSLPLNGPAFEGFNNRSAGNSAHVSSSSRSGRWLDCSPGGAFAQAGLLNGNGNIGADGKTVYVSFLQRSSSAGRFYEFEFHRDNLGDPGRIAGIGNDIASSTQVHLRAPADLHTPLGPGNTNVNLYVVRIDFNAGNDDLRVYRNPAALIESDNSPVLTLVSMADMAFDGIAIAAYLNGVTVKTDEIRIGTSWSSVLGDPPAFVLQPASQLACVGQSVTFTSDAESSAPLSYQWHHNGTALPDGTHSSLTLPNVQLTDAGSYFVTASNALGTVSSATVALAVHPILLSFTGPSTLPVEPGSIQILNPSLLGAEPLGVQWYRDDVPLPDATNTTLTLGTGGYFDAGRYHLVGSNPFGSVTSAVVTVYPNLGGLLAYDGFKYGASGSDIAGANGGFGWAAPWVSVTGNASQSSTNSLLAGPSAPPGFDAHSVGGSLTVVNASRKARVLDCSPDGPFGRRGYIDGNGNIGADGATIYISFLQKPSAVVKFYEFELKRGSLGDDGRIAGVGNDRDDTNVHLRTQSPPGGSSTFHNLGPGNTNVNLYVLRIDFQNGNDSVTVYRNPASSTEPEIPTATVAAAADLSFNGLSLGAFVNGVTVDHDEVRVGMTWADVAGESFSQLRLAGRTNQQSTLLLAGSPNYSYQFLAGTNPVGPWNPVAAAVMPALGITRFVDTNAADPARFYRALNGITASEPADPDLVFADFEQTTYGDWIATGTAFGSGPAQGTLPSQQTVSGYHGSRLVNSFLGGDTSTGTLTSPPFVISKPFINFLIGGGYQPGLACINLFVDGGIVRTATGANSEALTPAQWDVREFIGQTAVLQIVDQATGSWGHINVDHIVQSDFEFPPRTRDVLITGTHLNFPVKNGAPMRRMSVTVNGTVIREFDIELADATPDWWAFTDVSGFLGETATIAVNTLPPGSSGLSAITVTNGIVGATDLYQEPLRPQVHFSSRRGWLNDANGLVYYAGEYHLYYQHNPYGWNWGNMHWGHAVSTNLVHWRELPIGLYPNAYGDMAFSGSAVVDWANTGGFKTGTNDVIVAAYTSTGRGECIAYSNDRGRTFTDYSGNPVVEHHGRDPRIFWFGPSNHWVMAVYDEPPNQPRGTAFYTSSDLRNWTWRSRVTDYFECPDLFPLPVDGQGNNVKWVLNDARGDYQIGSFDGRVFTPETVKLPGNGGNAFYASQTFSDMPPQDGRRIQISWGQIPSPGMPFNQMMLFPTELALQTTPQGIRLCAQPVREIDRLHSNEYAWNSLFLSPGSNPLAGIRGELFELRAEFAPGAAAQILFTFRGVSVAYNPVTQQITCNGISNPLPPINGTVHLQVLVDRTSLEIFGNGGRLYMPMRASYAAGNRTVTLATQGGTAQFTSLQVFTLNTIWTQP